MRLLLAAALTLPLSACSYGLTGATDEAPFDTGGLAADPGTPDDEAAATGDEEAAPTAVEVEGKLYAISPDDLTVMEPAGLDAVFDEVLTRDVLVYVEDETSETLMLDVALAGADGRQDPCEAVRQFPAADWSRNPVFEAGPGELATSFGGQPATFRHLQLGGTFDEYAFAWREGTLSAQLDTRELQAALPREDDLCGLVEDLGGACEPCDDGEEACFALRLEDIVAELVDGSFEPRNRSTDCE